MRIKALLAVAVSSGLFIVSQSSAVVLFSDGFDGGIGARGAGASSDPLAATSTAGIGGSITPNSPVYKSGYHDTAGVTNVDANANNGGALQINSGTAGGANNTLQKVGSGTANLFVDHNFTEATSFSVSVDITAISQSGQQQGGAFAIGMTAANAFAAGDGFSGHGNTASSSNLTDPKFQDAFSDQTGGYAVGGAPAGQADGSSIAPFWMALRGNNTVTWGGYGRDNYNATTVANDPNGTLFTGGVGLVGTNVGAKTGTISAVFTTTDFNAGTLVNYSVYYNSTPGSAAGTGTLLGSGTFTWHDTNANYIGLDTRDSTLVQFDNLTVSSVPEPASIGLLSLATIAGLRRRSAVRH